MIPKMRTMLTTLQNPSCGSSYMLTIHTCDQDADAVADSFSVRFGRMQGTV